MTVVAIGWGIAFGGMLTAWILERRAARTWRTVSDNYRRLYYDEMRQGAVERVQARTVAADAAAEVRERVIEALRDAHRHDSAADAVEYVSEVVGWSAEDDPAVTP